MRAWYFFLDNIYSCSASSAALLGTEAEGQYLTVQCGEHFLHSFFMPALVIDSEAGGDIASQPVQADIGQQEVFAEGHLVIAASPV